MGGSSFAAETAGAGGFVTAGPCLVLAGPTASGKSALAVALAQALGGEVVNADSMQVYRDLSILTARPGAVETGGVSHHLYGVLAGRETCAAGMWLAWMHRLLPEIWGRGRLPVVVGGTGLYLRALIHGLAPVPQVPAVARAAAAADYDRLGEAAFAAELAALDPVSAAEIPPRNRQRMIRALEVARATGKPLSAWREEPHRGGLSRPPVTLLIDPDRVWLYERCDRRFLAMLDAGAWEQVADALAAGLSVEDPVCRGLGTRALVAALAGEIGRDAAVERAQRETRNYAKRQLTWFRHQLAADVVIRPPRDDPESPRFQAEMAAKAAALLESAHKS
jgi:tRNA dimethylallyltransferase